MTTVSVEGKGHRHLINTSDVRHVHGNCLLYITVFYKNIHDPVIINCGSMEEYNVAYNAIKEKMLA